MSDMYVLAVAAAVFYSADSCTIKLSWGRTGGSVNGYRGNEGVEYVATCNMYHYGIVMKLY